MVIPFSRAAFSPSSQTSATSLIQRRRDRAEMQPSHSIQHGIPIDRPRPQRRERRMFPVINHTRIFYIFPFWKVVKPQPLPPEQRPAMYRHPALPGILPVDAPAGCPATPSDKPMVSPITPAPSPHLPPPRPHKKASCSPPTNSPLHPDRSATTIPRKTTLFCSDLYLIFSTIVAFHSLSTIALITPFAGSSHPANSAFTSPNPTRWVI